MFDGDVHRAPALGAVAGGGAARRRRARSSSSSCPHAARAGVRGGLACAAGASSAQRPSAPSCRACWSTSPGRRIGVALAFARAPRGDARRGRAAAPRAARGRGPRGGRARRRRAASRWACCRTCGALARTHPALRVAGCIEPARTVGGDFYDCFMLDGTGVYSSSSATFRARACRRPSSWRCRRRSSRAPRCARDGRRRRPHRMPPRDRPRQPRAALRHGVRRRSSTWRPASSSTATPATSRRTSSPPARARSACRTPAGRRCAP